MCECPWTRAINPDINHIKTGIFGEFEGLLKIFFGLVTEANDDVGSDRNVAVEGSDAVDKCAKLGRCVAAKHLFQDGVGT